MAESKRSDSKEDSAGGWRQIAYSDVEIGERIGGGGVGIIYDGWFNNTAVALKTLFDTRVSEELKQEYMDELLVMSRVQHSNIVKFIGASMKPPHLFFVMERCECSLFDVLHNSRDQISDRDTVRMAIDVASAMEYLHAQTPAIIHRDLKSHNVLRAYDGSLKVCDFGLVKVRNPCAGTPAYMAPELVMGQSFNKSVDVYAFAILLWEMIQRQIPFYMVDIQEIRRKVAEGERLRIPVAGCTPRCGRLIKQAWSTASEDRPTFEFIVDELLAIFDEIPESKYTESLSVGGDSLDSLMFK